MALKAWRLHLSLHLNVCLIIIIFLSANHYPSLCARERERERERGGGGGVRLGKEKVEAVFVVEAKHKQPHSSKMTTAGNLIVGGRT